MKQVVMDGSLPFLPQEIITNILKRLPVKSLIRFQCVCKPWKNLFKTPSFIADHLHHSHQTPTLLFECYGECDPSRECIPLHLCLLDRKMQVLELQNAPLIDSMMFVRIVGSSNGLLCVRLAGKYDSFLLCNPAIRDVRRVPKALIRSEAEDFFVGFGFSPIVDDYKIVRLYVSMAIDDLVYKVQVYSLNTGSWKNLEVGNLEGVTLRKAYGFSTNGSIFWFGSKLGVEEEGENGGHLIVSFDIATEIFTLIPMPAVDFNFRTSFTVYENKLALLYPIAIANSKSSLIELWVMEEGIGTSGEKCSWTKKYTSGPYPCLSYPMTIWRNEIVCRVNVMPGLIRETEGEVENDETKAVMFNLATNEFKMFTLRRFGHGYCIFNYAESLLPVSNIHIEER